MVEKDPVFSGKIKQSGLFDFKEFYRFCYTWLVDEDYDVLEKTYSEKVTAQGKEVEIAWIAEKKVTDYFKFVLKVSWRILGMNTVEVEKNGKKMNMEKGNVEIKVSGVLYKDYEHRWDKGPVPKFLRTIYDKYLIRSRIEHFEGKIFEEADEFLAQAKSFLAIEGVH